MVQLRGKDARIVIVGMTQEETMPYLKDKGYLDFKYNEVGVKDFVLSSRFDDIRNYIRYGTWSENLWFRFLQGPVPSVDVPNDNVHVVGYMWYPKMENGHCVDA